MRTRPDIVPRRIRRPGMFSGGDGSTLSLDFTSMSSLDSRFTFSRSSPATFINSSGLVQYADSNMITNGDMLDANNTPTGWSFFSASGGSVSIPTAGSRTVSTSGSGQQPFLNQTITLQQGVVYTLSLVVTAVSNVTYANIAALSGATATTLYVNGSVVSNLALTATTGNYSYVVTAGSGSQVVRIGTGAASASTGASSMTFTNARLQPGSFATTSYVSSGTSGAYQAPRFDYDPTTLAPRGLLLEGSATNLMTYSEDFNAAAWTDTSITRATGNADPAGGTTAVRFTASAGNATVIRAAAIGTSAERTFSVWLRRVTGTGNIQYTQNNGTNWTTSAITSTWTRYSFTHTVDHRVGIRIVTSGDAIEMWGAQLETGAGASSYIPTGASTVQRAADSCSIALSNFGFSTTGGTFYADYFRGTFGTGDRGVLGTDYTASRWLGLFNVNGSTTTYVGSWSGSMNVAGASTRNKAAYAYGSWTGTVAPVGLCVNGGSVNNANRDFNPSTATFLVIGAFSESPPYSTANRDFLNNCVASIKYWPTRLPDATLRSLTA